MAKRSWLLERFIRRSLIKHTDLTMKKLEQIRTRAALQNITISQHGCAMEMFGRYVDKDLLRIYNAEGMKVVNRYKHDQLFISEPPQKLPATKLGVFLARRKNYHDMRELREKIEANVRYIHLSPDEKANPLVRSVIQQVLPTEVEDFEAIMNRAKGLNEVATLLKKNRVSEYKRQVRNIIQNLKEEIKRG